jgi:hypothetical protein
MKTKTQRRLCFAAAELTKDLPFFGLIGFICGVIQLVGYEYFRKSEAGTKLLQEHIAFNSMLLIAIFLLVVKGPTERLCARSDHPYLRKFISHVSARGAAFASVAASTLVGFGLSALLSGQILSAAILIGVAIYFLAITEVVLNPFSPAGWSHAYPLALGIVIGTPLAVRLS